MAGRPGRIVLLLTSPRSPAGLLSWPAWSALRGAGEVFAAGLDPEWEDALAGAEVVVTDVADHPVGRRAGLLVDAALDGPEGRLVVWFGSPDGDPGLTDALAEHLSRRSIAAEPPEIEVVTGSHDVPGGRLIDLVAVMDRLRSPGGCPWDAEQTHRSLLPYLLEEAHEVLDAVERGHRDDMREELGDLLLQVVFHARMAEDDPEQPFDIDDVAAGIVGKLVRRHPHVFSPDGGAPAAGAADVDRAWEELKAREKGRRGLFEGIPLSLPALARAQEMVGRLEAAGLLDPPGSRGGTGPGLLAEAAGSDDLAAALLDAVCRARDAGVDAEGALRATLGRLTERAGP